MRVNTKTGSLPVPTALDESGAVDLSSWSLMPRAEGLLQRSGTAPDSVSHVHGSLPQKLKIEQNEVHVWSARLNLGSSSIEGLQRRLDRHELDRASRFRFERDRAAFVIARGVLRTLLGRYLGEQPERIQFEYGVYGKPALAARSSMPRVRFNLSHSDTVALFAVTLSAEVGIDVERIRGLTDMDEIARRFFSKQEVADLHRLPMHSRERAFFACWTAKEAYIKGIGEGLSMPLDRFAVSLSPSEGPVRLRVRDERDEVTPWCLYRFDPSPGFIAALAVQARDFRLELGWLSPEEMIR